MRGAPLKKPSPWGPTPLVKGRCRVATEGIGKGAPVRTLGRMRGQSEEQASLEELCRAGDRPRRVCPFPFRECGEDFAAPAASDFLDGQKVTKEPLGGGRNRQKRLRRPCLHAARPLEPPLRGDAYLLGFAVFPARKI